MKVLKILGAIIIIIAVTVVVLMFTLSGKLHVERSVVINTDPEKVYAELITFEEFNAWSPWFERDSTAQYTYEGPQKGVGAKMSWTSEDPEVGNGAMWIVEAEPNKMVNNRMKFGDYPGEPNAAFYLEPMADGTNVTWTYDEEVKGIWKVMTLFTDMDEMLGPDYERGLEKLKAHIESEKVKEQEMKVVETSAAAE